jgi:hypothetical protein
MYTPSWHAEGLRWIASLFLGAAERLERASLSARPCGSGRAGPPPVEDFIDDVRMRIHSRYF